MADDEFVRRGWRGTAHFYFYFYFFFSFLSPCLIAIVMLSGFRDRGVEGVGEGEGRGREGIDDAFRLCLCSVGVIWQMMG